MTNPLCKNYDLLYRYIIIGDIAVGKSCILLQLTEGQFKSFHDLTIGVAFGVKNINLNNKIIKLQIWDTSGQEAFKSVGRTYYKGAHGALLVYDITKRQTFLDVKNWLEEIKNNSPKNVKIILVGNKCDLDSQREVTFQEGETYAKENNLLFLETSAKTSYNIENAFTVTANEIYKEFNGENHIFEDNNSNTIELNKENSKKENNILSGLFGILNYC